MADKTDKPKKSRAEKIAESLSTPTPREAPVGDEEFLSSGIVPLNLAATGRPHGFVRKGRYCYLVGDSSSGKSSLTLNLFAEAARSHAFDSYRLIFDKPEHGVDMDIPRMFGSRVASRLRPPRGSPVDPQYSTTVQQFFYNVDSALDDGPCIYVLDSVDAIGADEDDEKFEQEKKAFEEGKEVSGSYGMAKPKYISRNIHRVVQRLDETGSILVLISQTRDKVGSTIPGLKTRGGGRALKFYAHLEVWSSVKGPIKKTVMGKEREIGSSIQFDIQKNRFTGWEGRVPLIPFYRSVGFDAIGAEVDFLVSEGRWDEKKGVITAPEFGFEGRREKLIEVLEESGREKELTALAADLWGRIERASAVVRKRRYE